MRLLAALADKQDRVESLLPTWTGHCRRRNGRPHARCRRSLVCGLFSDRIRVAELRLGRVGWDPRVVSQSGAVSEAGRIGPETFGLRLSLLWCRAVAAFIGSAEDMRPKPPRVR